MDVDSTNYVIVAIIIIFIIIIILIVVISNNDTNQNDILHLKSIKTPLDINFSYYLSITDLFNLSVIRSSGKYIGLIRGCNKTKNYSLPLYIEIDDNNVKNIKLLDFDDDDFYSCNNNGIEDPRIFQFKNEYWGIANCLGYKNQKYKSVNTMCIFKLDNAKTTFRLLYHPENSNLIQKNWSPFVHNNKLYCEYSINPHLIYEINTETGSIDNIIRSNNNYKFEFSGGRLSGGSPPILISHFREPIYLSVGHIRLSNNNYYNFFYMFESHPPFNIIGSSKIFKLDNKEQIQIVTALSICGDELHVSYGINNKYNKISIFNIYDINSKINYDPKYINNMISKSLKKEHKLTIVSKDFNTVELLELQKYCDKYGYKLQNNDTDLSNENGMILLLYRSMQKIEKLNINYNNSFDIILNMAGDSKYICFEGLNDRFMHSSLLNSDKNDYINEYNLITHDDYLNIINMGYPHRKNIGVFLHQNYLYQILYSEKSIFSNDTTIMPGVIKAATKTNNTKIPKIIHQSFGSRVVPECLASAVHAWLNLNPEYEYRYYDNGDCRKLIVDNFDDNVVKAFDMLLPGAYRCDLWRVCAIYLYGGIYADIKLGEVFPIKNIIDDDVDYLFINDIHDNAIYNGLFGAKAKDPVIYKVIMETVRRVLNKEYGSGKLYPTGPLAVGSVIVKEFGFDKHMKIGKYKVNNSVVTVYDHNDDGNWGRTINNKDGFVLINFRHNPKTSDQNLFNSITGKSHYGVLWAERKIYRDL